MLKARKDSFLLQKFCQIHYLSKEFLSWQVSFIASRSSAPCPNHWYSSKLSLPERLIIQRLGIPIAASDIFFCKETDWVYVCPSPALAQLGSPGVCWAAGSGQRTSSLVPDWGSIQQFARLRLWDGLFYVDVMDEDSGANGWPFHNTDPVICKAFVE